MQEDPRYFFIPLFLFLIYWTYFACKVLYIRYMECYIKDINPYNIKISIIPFKEDILSNYTFMTGILLIMGLVSSFCLGLLMMVMGIKVMSIILVAILALYVLYIILSFFGRVHKYMYKSKNLWVENGSTGKYRFFTELINGIKSSFCKCSRVNIELLKVDKIDKLP